MSLSMSPQERYDAIHEAILYTLDVDSAEYEEVLEGLRDVAHWYAEQYGVGHEEEA